MSRSPKRRKIACHLSIYIGVHFCDILFAFLKDKDLAEEGLLLDERFCFSRAISARWLVGCFGLNDPLRQYFSLYRAVSLREGDKREKCQKNPPSSTGGGGRVVRWCWVNFQCRGVLQFGYNRARAYCARSRCGWGLFGHFYSPLSFLSCFSLSLGDGLI